MNSALFLKSSLATMLVQSAPRVADRSMGAFFEMDGRILRTALRPSLSFDVSSDVLHGPPLQPAEILDINLSNVSLYTYTVDEDCNSVAEKRYFGSESTLPVAAAHSSVEVTINCSVFPDLCALRQTNRSGEAQGLKITTGLWEDRVSDDEEPDRAFEVDANIIGFGVRSVAPQDLAHVGLQELSDAFTIAPPLPGEVRADTQLDAAQPSAPQAKTRGTLLMRCVVFAAIAFSLLRAAASHLKAVQLAWSEDVFARVAASRETPIAGRVAAVGRGPAHSMTI